MLLPLRGVATPGHGEGEGSAVDKFRVSGTQETVEGTGANEVSGVLSEASCCRCGAPLIKKKRPTLFSRPLSFSDLSHHRTCRSAYGGSLHSVQLNVVVHKARVASTAKFIVPRSVVHYAFRIGPISFTTVPIDSRPVWLDATLN